MLQWRAWLRAPDPTVTLSVTITLTITWHDHQILILIVSSVTHDLIHNARKSKFNKLIISQWNTPACFLTFYNTYKHLLYFHLNTQHFDDDDGDDDDDDDDEANLRCWAKSVYSTTLCDAWFVSCVLVVASVLCPTTVMAYHICFPATPRSTSTCRQSAPALWRTRRSSSDCWSKVCTTCDSCLSTSLRITLMLPIAVQWRSFGLVGLQWNTHVIMSAFEADLSLFACFFLWITVSVRFLVGSSWQSLIGMQCVVVAEKITKMSVEHSTTLWIELKCAVSDLCRTIFFRFL